ncbi:hypothetical protein JHL22_01655 [Advenella sp. WQ 585]|uniref:Uncharacterized protein n=1 Tax=Advenella mandrilli TaxID=2800330 RepID=A0ABS1EAH7_9BURK|nr:hypothetical protein [Advenella mandrilli]MBK1779915.1 hypothetical protein [Advenella mandrilli]
MQTQMLPRRRKIPLCGGVARSDGVVAFPRSHALTSRSWTPFRSHVLIQMLPRRRKIPLCGGVARSDGVVAFPAPMS